MEKIVVDAKGLLCPQPLIMTKKALKDLPVDREMVVIIDNATSMQNVLRFLKDNNARTEVDERNGVFTLTIQKKSEKLAHPDAESYCVAPSQARRHVIVVRGETMGAGDDELGTILIKAFINTIKEVSPLPESVVFYNRGIFLTLENSPVLDSLYELQSQGVSVLVCGTCADYFGKKDAVKVGTVSNMYTILEAMTAASHIIEP